MCGQPFRVKNPVNLFQNLFVGIEYHGYQRDGQSHAYEREIFLLAG